MTDAMPAQASMTPDKKEFSAQPTQVQGTPQRRQLYANVVTRRDTNEAVPTAIECTRTGQMKVFPLGPRVERIGGGLAQAAGGVVFTAKCALTDVKIVVVNITTGQSAYTLNHCLQGVAVATNNRLSYLKPIEKGDRDTFEGLGLEAGDTIQCLCTVNNDFCVHIYGRRWVP